MFGKTKRRIGWHHVAATVLACGLLTVETGCKAEQPWPLWQAYRARFVESSGRVIDHDPAAGDRTTSEGMAYAMFFALVDNDRGTFDKMLRWTEENLAQGDLTARLPGWNWGKNAAGEWKPLDTNSASDADLWLAYDLLEAGRLWHDARFENLGVVMLNRIEHAEIGLAPGVGPMLVPGASGFRPQPNTLILNPSYMPPQLLARLRNQEPAGPWGSVMHALPHLLRVSSAGYAMDWVAADIDSVHASATPAELARGKLDAVPVGSYDAIRVYLWLGMADKDTDGVRDSLQAVAGMAKYLQSNTTPPLQIGADGKVINAEGTTGFSAAVIPYLTATGHKNEAKIQTTRLQATFDSSSGFYGHASEYYDQNLALFTTGFQEGRFRFDKDGKLKLMWK